MKIAYFLIATILIATHVFACEALLPKNSLKTPAVCGHVQAPDGEALPDFGLQLVRKDQTVAAVARTDAAGNFQFESVERGDYYMITNSKGWAPLGWPVNVTSSKAFRNCGHPLIVQPSLVCGGSVSKKGYHPRF